MAVTSEMVPLGSTAPDFTLPAVDGREVSLSDLSGTPALLVVFLCNHCPYVRHLESSLGATLAEYAARGLTTVGICSNDADSYPDDRPEKLAEQAARAGWTFPYLVDATQDVGRAYQAACTPDFFLFDGTRSASSPTGARTTDRHPGTACPSPASRCATRSTGCSQESRSPNRTGRAWAAPSSGATSGSACPLVAHLIANFSSDRTARDDQVAYRRPNRLDGRPPDRISPCGRPMIR